MCGKIISINFIFRSEEFSRRGIQVQNVRLHRRYERQIMWLKLLCEYTMERGKCNTEKWYQVSGIRQPLINCSKRTNILNRNIHIVQNVYYWSHKTLKVHTHKHSLDFPVVSMRSILHYTFAQPLHRPNSNKQTMMIMKKLKEIAKLEDISRLNGTASRRMLVVQV